MSRLAKKPILLPKGVDVSISNGQVSVKGPKGTLQLFFPEGVDLVNKDQALLLQVKEGVELEKPTLGLHRALLNNAITGVSEGFSKQLQLVGVGYRATIKGKKLDLQLGFSHPCEIDIPEQLKVEVDKNTTINIFGTDKKLVGHFAAVVRGVKPPEPYKGKGIRYTNEYVRKKAGKAAKGK